MVDLDDVYMKRYLLLLHMLGQSVVFGFVAGGVLGGSYAALIMLIDLVGSPSFAETDVLVNVVVLVFALSIAASIGGVIGIILGSIAGIINGLIISLITLLVFLPLTNRRVYRPIMKVVSTLVITILSFVIAPAILKSLLPLSSSDPFRIWIQYTVVPAAIAGCVGFWFGGYIAKWYEGEMHGLEAGGVK